MFSQLCFLLPLQNFCNYPFEVLNLIFMYSLLPTKKKTLLHFYLFPCVCLYAYQTFSLCVSCSLPLPDSFLCFLFSSSISVEIAELFILLKEYYNHIRMLCAPIVAFYCTPPTQSPLPFLPCRIPQKEDAGKA